MKFDPQPDDYVFINGSGDLMMDRSMGKHIDERVRVVKKTKAGLYQVETSDGEKSFAKRNLSPCYRAKWANRGFQQEMITRVLKQLANLKPEAYRADPGAVYEVGSNPKDMRYGHMAYPLYSAEQIETVLRDFT